MSTCTENRWDAVEGRLRPFPAEGGHRPGVYAGLTRNEMFCVLGLTCHARLRASCLLLVVLVFGACCFSPLSADESNASAQSQSKPQQSWHWPKVVISKETTCFTEPLRSDGGVDYVAALNRKYSQGVTPENNAAVALWQAAGPKELKKQFRKRYFKMLGIAELPEKGDYFASYDDFPEYQEAKKQPDEEAAFWQKLGEQERAVESAPWSKQDYPIIAAFLERNEKPLEILSKGLQRTRFYSPLVAADENFAMCGICVGPVNGINNARTAARLFKMRAMLRLHDGDLSGTWRDILSLYRLGRLASHGASMVNWMSAATFEGMANEAAVVLSQQDGLTVEQARKCQQQLRRLSPMQSLVETFDVGERCSSIEVLTLLADDPGVFFEDDELVEQMLKVMDPKRPSREPERKRRRQAFKILAARHDVDWSEVFRRHNVFWNRLTDAYRCSSGEKIVATLQALELETSKESQKSSNLVLSEKLDVVANMDAITKAKHIANLAILPFNFFNWKTGGWIAQRQEAGGRMTQLAFALAGYRAEHQGKYPKTLAELAPKYIDAIPKDPFADGEFRYKSDGDGYLLYGLGSNGKDDGGFGPGNMPESATEEQRKAWDDISIRTPPKKTK